MGNHTIAHPDHAAIASARSQTERAEQGAPAYDPWAEVWDAAMKMASAAYLSGRLDNDDARRASEDAAGEFGRIHTRLEFCYAGVRVAYCTACERPRMMSEPREWEAEIQELGGPKWTAECLSCGSTIAVGAGETTATG